MLKKILKLIGFPYFVYKTYRSALSIEKKANSSYITLRNIETELKLNSDYRQSFSLQKNLPKNPNKNIIVAMAHPDDAEIFAGGTLLLLKSLGWNIHIVIFTSGQLGSKEEMSVEETIRVRSLEAKDSATIFDATLDILSGMDGALTKSQGVRQELNDCIQRYNPNIVITHNKYDDHPDHRACCDIVSKCLDKLDKKPSLYFAMNRLLFNSQGIFKKVDFYIDISKTCNEKLRAFNRHRSQVKLIDTMLVYKTIGRYFGVDQAEGFIDTYESQTLQDELKECLLEANIQ